MPVADLGKRRQAREEGAALILSAEAWGASQIEAGGPGGENGAIAARRSPWQGSP
jgi:hypothetical protein